MSSWKQYGGIYNYERSSNINTDTLTVNTLLFKESINGSFDICGQMHVTGNALFDTSIFVNGNTYLNKNVDIGTVGAVPPYLLNIYNNSTFYGSVVFTSDFVTQGNIDSNKNVNVKNNVVIGNILYFDNGNSQFIYGNTSGLGINTMTPTAGLDISTNLIRGINIQCSQTVNENILAQNNQNKGIILGADLSNTYIQFFNDHTIPSNIPDATITYQKGGVLSIDVSNNINLLATTSVSNRNTTDHVNGETFVVYDTSSGIYITDKYVNNTQMGTGISVIGKDSSSNTFIRLTTPNRVGTAIGGGVYPEEMNRSMVVIGLTDSSGTITPAQTIVSGKNILKYHSTTGINTLKPSVDTYVLDINGPVHIDNGDITDVTGNVSFELYSISVPKTSRNHVIALGSSYDISGDFFDPSSNLPFYREQIIKSTDYGTTWKTIDLPNIDLKGNAVTSVYMYDESNVFVTGYNNTIMYSWGSGNLYTWKTLSTIGLPQANYTNVVIQSTPKINGNIVGHFSFDMSSTLITFEFAPVYNPPVPPFNPVFNTNLNPIICNNNLILDKITAMDTATQSLYLAGNVIAKYYVTNTVFPVSNSPLLIHNSSYPYNDIAAFDNSFVIGVGANIISSTRNGGLTWTDISFSNIDFKSVFIYDSTNAIAVGSAGNIWTTKNAGITWNYINRNIIDPSGKSNMITDASNNYKNVVMTDANTILLVNTIQPYNYLNQYGVSNIYNVFAPNYVNSANNIVFDVCGTIHISEGDLQLNNGSITSDNNVFNLLNTHVKTLNIGGNTTALYLGNSGSGNTIVNNNLSVSGTTSIQKLNILSDLSLNGNLSVNGRSTFQSFATFNGNLIAASGVYTNSVIPNGNTITVGGGDIDIYLGGEKNATREQKIYIGQREYSETYPSTIYIGGPTDRVFLRGNTTIEQKTDQVVASKTIIINKTGVDIDFGNATAGGAGIDIFDNSNSTIYPNDSTHIYSYIHVGNDLQSFVLKAPSYGTFNGGVPDPNSGNPLQLISPENRLKIGVNELTLADKPHIRNGLVILQSNADYIAYQSSRGHSYVNGDADYVMNVCDIFDISNIMLKNVDTIAGTQSIATSLIIGNTVSPKNLTVFGNSVLNGNLTIHGNTDITGNMIIPNLTVSTTLTSNTNTFLFGNVGIGTNTPQVSLDIIGNTRVVGQLVSSNYDTIQFPTNYGNTWLPENTNPLSNTHYQDIAVSYDAKYQYAFMYNKYNVGSIQTSSDFGGTWTNVSLPANSSNTIINQAIPYMSSNSYTFTYPELQGNIAGGSPLNIQTGTYRVTGTSTQALNGGAFWNAFDNSFSTAWTSANNRYQGSGEYVGAVTTFDNRYSQTIGGEYVQIQLPYSYIVKTYRIYPAIAGLGNYYPKILHLLGSVDGTNWFSVSGSPSGNDTSGNNTFDLSANTSSYSYYRIIVQSISSLVGATIPCQITNLDFSGIVQNVTGAYSGTLATSATGKYVTLANQAYNVNSGNLFVSNNYGTSYSDTNIRASGNGTWQQVAMSQTGQYQYAVISNTLSQGNLFVSSNYGANWTDSLFGVANGLQSVNVSSDGKYVTAVQSGNIASPLGNIWSSNNYGALGSWSSSQTVYSYVPYIGAAGSGNQGAIDFNKILCMSTSGKYQTVLGLANSTDSTGNANIWINSNYGVGAWIDTGHRAFGGNCILSSVSMTSNGRYQTASYIGGATSNVMKSTDYGVTWTNLNYKTPNVTVGPNTYSGFLPKIATIVNGRYIVGIQKYKDISANTYNNNNSTATGIGNVVSSTIPITDNMFSTQYMGSSYTGNVFATHGIQLNVLNDNNASLFMGYDTTLDITYINSADEYNYNPICLNANGGAPVGVATVTPGANYALDVSGIINTTNTKGVLSIQTPTATNNIGIGSSTSEIFNSLTTGSQNTAVGSNTMKFVTSGSQNTAVGYNAFTTSSVFNNCTAIGYNANPTASNQVVLGTELETVYIPGNMGLGKSTASYTLDVSGIINITNTKGLFYVQTPTATDNIGIGSSSSGIFNSLTTSGIQNTAIGGANTMKFVTSGSQNTAVGYNTMTNNTTGINNTALGCNAFTTSSVFNHSTAIGYNANPTASNQVVLGTELERVYILGNVGIGTANPRTKLDVSGVCSANSFNITSDYRAKQNVVPLLENRTVDALRPVEYDLNGESHDMGFIAHEVQEHFPFLVRNEKDGEAYQSLNYTGLIAVIVKEIQELKKENRELKEILQEILRK